ncbi:MAG: branched-chain amino acid ABC transporter permease, partial [Actinomycetes bacterium]
MELLFSLLVAGLSIGAVYALVALGLVVIYKATRVVNFAQPALLVLGTYVVASAHVVHGLAFPLAILAGIVVTVVVAVLVDRVLVRRFQRTSAVVAASIMTIGLDVVVSTETERRIGTRILSTGDPWGDDVVTVLGLSVPTVRLVSLSVSLLLLVVFQQWLHRSDYGIAMRAAAEDPEAASLMGIRLGRVSATAWGVAGVLAVVAGVFLVAYPNPGLDTSVEAVALRALPAANIGGLDSTPGAIAGGFLVGLRETLVGGYQSDLIFLGRGFDEVAAYVVM